MRAVQLQPDSENNLLLDAQLGLLFNITGTKKLAVEGCPAIDIISTTYEEILLSMDSEAKELEVVNHPHPTIKRRGLFTRRVGSLIHEYLCKTIQAPMVELSYCLTGIPVVLRGELHMIDTNSRVITAHLEQQMCERGFPMTIQTAGDSKIWVQISKEVLQVKDPNPLHERSNSKTMNICRRCILPRNSGNGKNSAHSQLCRGRGHIRSSMLCV